MPPAGGPTGPRQHSDGPPSEQARAALAERLRRDIADTRIRLEEVGLRAETHRLLGQHDAAADVLHEQDQLLADLQDRLGRAVSAAVVERDAEQVLADVMATGRLGSSLHPDTVDPVHVPDATPAVRARPPVLAGVTSLVAVLGLAAAAVLGLTRGVAPVEVTEAAADSSGGQQASEQPLAGPTPLDSAIDRPAHPASDPTSSAPGTVTPTGAPTSDAQTAVDDDTENPSPSPSPSPELAPVVQELIDAVEGLGDAGGSWEWNQDEVPNDYDSSVPGVDEVVDELAGEPEDGDDGQEPADEDPAAEPTDADAPAGGFVPRRTAQ